MSPGHLVATATAPGGVPEVVWRWFDAVVVEEVAGQVRLSEPAHRPGSRAYLSAGLEGANWWVAEAAVALAEDAEVELDEVRRFLTVHGFLDSLT